MIFTIFVKTKSLHTLAEVVRESCEGMLIDGRPRRVELRGENVKDVLEEQYAIDVFTEVMGEKEMRLLFSIATVNEEIKVIYVSCPETDLIEFLIVNLLGRFGWDRVKWLCIPEENFNM